MNKETVINPLSKSAAEASATSTASAASAAATAAPARSHKKKILIGFAIFISILFFVFVILGMGRGAAGAYNSIFGGSDSKSSDKECILPPNMKWKDGAPIPIQDGLNSNYEVMDRIECIDPDATPSPSKGRLVCKSSVDTKSNDPPEGDGILYVYIKKDNVDTWIPPTCPTPKEPCPTPTNAIWVNPNAFKKSQEANIENIGTTAFIKCKNHDIVPSPSKGISLDCNDGIAKVKENPGDKEGTVITCPSIKQGYANYLGELLDWISGRPDINQQSKYSLLPGYFN